MNTTARRIGTIGTVSRVIVGLGLLYLAVTHGLPSWHLRWYDPVLGLIALPAVMIVAGLAARRFAGRDVHFTGPLGVAVNCAVILALAANRYTAGGAEIFYGITLLAAAWCRQPGCEATVLSNLILGRDDQIGCPVFTPIDAVEARRSGRRRRQPGTPRTSEARPTRTMLMEATHMAIDHEQPASRRDDQHAAELWRNPLTHVAACLAVGALAVLAVLAIHWLT